MKIQYDSEVDALYIEFRHLKPGTAENRELSEDVIANYGPEEKLAGIEILNASIVLGEELLGKIVLEVIPAHHTLA